GNIWRFPCEAGSNGGGAFIIIYILCVLVVCIPLMVAEFVAGRSTHKNVLGAVKQLSHNKYFSWLPYMCIFASIIVIGFYSVVCGWIVEYLIQSVTGGMSGHAVGDYGPMFQSFVENPYRSVLWTVLFLIANYLVLIGGVKKGIERVSRIMMPLLFIILIVFCINSLMMPEVRKGLDFMFRPDFDHITPGMVLGAMGQAFFSLSLGLSCMLTYGSYFTDDAPLTRRAVVIALLDTLVAILAGVMIFPAVFSYGMQAEAGPTLVFQTFPAIFSQMPGGPIWAFLFFLLLFFAAITSTISMSEVSIAFFVEERKMKRPVATVFFTVLAIVIGAVCALSFGVLNHLKVAGLTIFELCDYICSNIFMPIGGIAFAVFVGWYLDRKLVLDQLTNGGTLRSPMAKPLLTCLRFVAPTVILLIFLYGIGVFNALL
ncbi:MAG: sodium-dependent transporter, partial [Muribaculaceae bacterium]|nr:sodium-dependent transporter [Muribaculaceae bacterium]